jgi:hypothetical protein
MIQAGILPEVLPDLCTHPAILLATRCRSPGCRSPAGPRIADSEINVNPNECSVNLIDNTAD